MKSLPLPTIVGGDPPLTNCGGTPPFSQCGAGNLPSPQGGSFIPGLVPLVSLFNIQKEQAYSNPIESYCNLLIFPDILKAIELHQRRGGEDAAADAVKVLRY